MGQFGGNLVNFAIKSWWRHQMETFSALLALCVGNSPVSGEFPAQSQWRGALKFSLICAWINGWINNRKAGNLRRRRTHYEIIIMNASQIIHFICICICQINNFTNISPSFSTQSKMRSLMISFYLGFRIFDFFVKLLICMLRNWCSVTVDVLKKTWFWNW